jgi:alcohol dehydrogenase, propanol-preferring
MKAWQFTNTGEPLVLADVVEPTVAPGEVVINIKAAGLCHTDVGVLDDPGWFTTLARIPITIGHEVAGVISQVGEGVTAWKVGDPVGVCPLSETAPGFKRDGGYSYKATARQEDLVRIPEGVTFAQAAIGTDAGMTSYHAVKVTANVKPGEKVGIIGFGGLGQIGARVAVLLGAEVYIAEINEAVWEKALEIGARKVVKNVVELADMKLDCIIDFAGFGTTTATAIDIIRKGGRVILVGMGRLETTISTKSLIFNETRLIASNGGNVDDIRGVYELFATGQLQPEISLIGFNEIPAGLERLRAGGVQGRIVADIDG